MKAYQIKIAVKNTKPPVWRRCIIPSGITFAQLSVILNEITGWNFGSYYEFEFYHRKQQLRENLDDEYFYPTWQYDLLESSETYIDEFMEQEEWFSYYAREERSYRVTIEKTVETEGAYPVVLKWKGECGQAETIEDLDVLNAVLQRKYVVTYGEIEFLQQRQLYEKFTSGEEGLCGSKNPINDECRTYKSVSSKMKDFAEQLQEHIMNAAQKYTDRDGKIVPSKELEQEMDRVYREFQDGMEERVWKEIFHAEVPEKKMQELPEKIRKLRLKEVLESYPKEDLLECARELKISDLSGLKKKDLAEKTADAALEPAVMKGRMLQLSDEEIVLFEKIMNSEYLYLPTEEEDELLDDLEIWNYVVCDWEGWMEVPIDVAAVYRKLSTIEFHKMRRKVVWMKKCLDILAVLYAVAPVEILLNLYRQHKSYEIEREELLEIFSMIPEEANPCKLVGERVIYKEVLRDKLYLAIEKHQEGKQFYIPTRAEIEDYAERKYFSAEPSYRKMGQFLERVLGMDGDEADFTLYELFQKLGIGANPHDVIDDLQEAGVIFPDEESVYKFIGLVMELNNNTRMVVHRGHKPCEMGRAEFGKNRQNGQMPTIIPGSSHAAKLLQEGKEELKRMGFGIDLDANAREIPSAVFANGTMQMRTRKVYPNDPCPCGSGKKYKKCCGRK